jgi:uncharacterized protein YlxW (UPF0749 family)
MTNLLKEKGLETDALQLQVIHLHKISETASVKHMAEITSLQASLKTKEEEINQLKASLAQVKRDFDQKLQQVRLKYEEHLLSVTSKNP